ncbi:hypothetical protein [Bacteroides stercoris]|uniref:hypothetical protein n=2 Tax=Bacteroides stercoris TaxID=46506 RepID=UPI00189E21A2|nr:hypothetical protein [Bacteroides stercoris]
MKEFTSQTGGRYTYIDDIMNLQDLALAFAGIFDGCDNFIISGCQVSGTNISAGYAYINGKIRYFTGTSGASKWPMYLYENNSVERVSYADSGDKIGRNVYGCAISANIPVSNDTLTKMPPQFISIASDGSALRLKEALFGKYALMIDSPYPSQTVKKDIVIDGDATFNKELFVKRGVNLVAGTSKASVFYSSSGALNIQSQLNEKTVYKVTITEKGAVQFHVNNNLLASLDSNGMVLRVALSSDIIKGGNVTVTNSHIYNSSVATDKGALNINMLGYNGSSSYYRDTIIGDGKGGAVLSIVGKSKECTFNGSVIISSVAASLLSLKHSTLSKTDNELVSYLNWTDKNSEQIAYIGYSNTEDKNLHFKNNIGDLVLNNDVHVIGKLFVNGVDLLAKTIDYPKDSGWIPIKVQNCGITTQVYVRQIGKIVSIQGELHTHHNGVIFTLPNNIDPPKYKIGYSHNKGHGSWHCVISGGQRNCVVDYCNNGCAEYIGFLMTYII